ncbi:hypothetical protein EXM90_19095 [Clostridium botulinum]|uniref:hypothetical protein n=1 Tax=Clostridium botulinum TaxID=1491 RepID=UPI000467540A|nr:hypothetical protein [Clostridium botulinum]APR02553.1 hypothetical protein RSJ2_3952 [Clostridium botulinum]MBN3367028.1 hypothetical protein [Clostridium botulinum]MBN3371664.1 hypothetical protein [Clostridium botulinum]MBN3375530.1 hypothetical protein [Clostridium botulinum]MBN3384187.1 hypothetical protein [Clostridium botulinum]
MKRNELDFNDNITILDIYSCANEVFGEGIAVPVENGHPCGWEWLDFKFIDDILTDKFESSDISNGCGNGEYEDLTLKEILLKTNGKFAFEVNEYTINWDKD